MVNVSAKSNSVGQSMSLLHWFEENYNFFKMRVKGEPRYLDHIVADIDHLSQLYRHNSGRDIRTARILEIGYGARPLRLMAMHSLGYDALGIDLDTPLLKPSLGDLARIYRANGAKRAVKSLVRSTLFDRAERAALGRSLARAGAALKIVPEKYLVGDAAELDLPAGGLDLIYSIDVFEHIPEAGLRKLLKSMRRMLSDHGLAVVCPVLFTGLIGGHLTEWYDGHVAPGAQTEPWEHLRQGRKVADCYLNKLRYDDYLALFSEDFDIIAVERQDYGMGEAYLTDAVLEELKAYSREELLSNTVRFILKPKV